MTKPTVFPTNHILTITLLTSVAFMLLLLFYSSFRKKNAIRTPDFNDARSRFLVIWVLFAAFAIRIMLSCYVVGHKTDINCFAIWGNNLVSKGFSNFYNPSSGMPDYPPGYMIILGLMSRISIALGHGVYSSEGVFDLVYVTIIKLPTIFADLAAAYLVYRIALKKLNFAPSLVLMAAVAFCPIMVYISSGWGQIDQLLALFIVLSILALISNKPILSGALYGIAILLKPQALMVGPLMALAFAFYVFDPSFFTNSEIKDKSTVGVRLLKTGAAVLLACVLIVAATIPFSTPQLPWYKLLYDKYLGTATSYKFASVNAYNVYTLFGFNWRAVDDASPLFGLTFRQVGTIGMAISVLFGGLLYVFGRKKNRGAPFLAAAFTLISLFTIGHYMHERYLFPALLLLVIAYIFYGDRRLLGIFFAYCVTTMVNCLAAFYYSLYHQYGLYWDKRIVFWCSAANVALFIILTVYCFLIMIIGQKGKDVFREDAPSVKPTHKTGRAK